MLVTLLAVALLRLCATNRDLPPVSTKAHPRGRLSDPRCNERTYAMVWITSTMRSRSSGERSRKRIPMPGLGLSPFSRTGFTHCTTPWRSKAPTPGASKRSARRVPTRRGSVVRTKMPICEMLEIAA
jgi:hypothetical protein